jgi:cytoskeleton protein RodZ
METVGESFKRARKSQKIDLNTVSQDLKISESLLGDIENNQFPSYINVTFLIGHIRSYAKYLNLDEKLLIENFKIQISFDGNNLNNEMRKPNTPVIQFSFFKALSFVSIIIISSSFYFLFIPSNDLQPEYAMTPNIPENLESTLEEIEMKLSLEKILIVDALDNTSQIIADSSQIIEDKDALISSTSAIASLPISNDKNLADKIVTLKFLNPTWVQLRDSKNNVIISKLMSKKDEFSFKISENLNLTTGNAGNIIILVDGVVKGKVGKIGEVIDSLIIDNRFYN